MANEKIVNRENLKAFREKFQDKLENGQIVPRLAKNLSPVSLESGATQETPFVLQGTGTANGTASVDTADVGKHLEKQGNSVVVNQWLLNNTFTNTNNWYTVYGSINVSSNVCSFTATAEQGFVYQNINRLANHKYLIHSSMKLTTASNNIKAIQIYDGSSWKNVDTQNNTNWNEYFYIFTQSSSVSETNNQFTRFAKDNRSSGWDTIQLKNVFTIDLTQWFGSNANIPQDLLDHPENWYRYYNGSLAYNTGTLVASNGRYLETGGRNLYDGEHDIVAIPNATYYCYGTSITLTYKDKSGNTISSETKTNETFTTPSNCNSIGVSGTGNICISLYYATGDGYDKYYPYETPKTYDTGTEVLRSAGSVRDIKQPDGTITRKVGVVDLGSLSWNKNVNNSFYASLSNVKVPQNVNTIANLLCSKYISATSQDVGAGNIVNNAIAISGSGNVLIDDDSLTGTSTPTGTLFYELATSITEQGTTFPENIEINDYGTMGWLDTNNAYVDIPQGCKIFYPADMALFVDSLGQRTDIEWDASEIVSHTELSSSIAFQELDSSYIDAITSSEIVSGEFYKNNIAYSGGLTNAKYVVAQMSNGILYPMILTSTLLVVYSGTNWQSAGLSVSKIYYKN